MPYGTPEITSIRLNCVTETTTRCFLCLRKFEIHSYRIIYGVVLVFPVSNAFHKS